MPKPQSNKLDENENLRTLTFNPLPREGEET
jgi:hypothetical protein